MTRYRFRLRGRGVAELAAYGVADAEHRVEKELAAAWPDARVRVERLRRDDEVPRIVESFTVEYAVEAEVGAEAASELDARRAAFRAARERFAGTRFRQLRWEAKPFP